MKRQKYYCVTRGASARPPRYEVVEMGLVVLSTRTLSEAIRAARDAEAGMGDGSLGIWDTREEVWVRW